MSRPNRATSTAAGLFGLGHRYQTDLDKWAADDATCDLIFIGNRTCDFALPGWLSAIQDAEAWKEHGGRLERHHPLWSSADFEEALQLSQLDPHLNLLAIEANELTAERAETSLESGVTRWCSCCPPPGPMPCAPSAPPSSAWPTPVVPVIVRQDLHGLSAEALRLKSARLEACCSTGSGGVWIAGDVGLEGGLQALNRTAFGILQATRTRISRTEYISCPSCGRTLFDLQETTAKIRAVTTTSRASKSASWGAS